MNATHNVVKVLSGNKSYLYTLIVKNKTINRGTPLAFLMTESASQYVRSYLIESIRRYTDND
jgi:hypothetical protein